jgi:hypothetical protein
MSDVAVICPHCNARKAGTTTGLAGKKLSPQEIHALIAADAMLTRAPSQGLLPTLILPHPSTTGAARAIELVLTVVSLPLVAAGALTLAVARSRTRRKHEASSGELGPVLAMLGLGGFGFSTVLSLLGLDTVTNLAVTGISMVALIVRGLIRSRAAAERSRELQRLV